MSPNVDPGLFAAAAGMLEERAGLTFVGARREALAWALATHIVSSGRSANDYLSWLASPDGAGEIQALLDAVTIQETSFFRNPAQFHALRTHVLPELVQRAAAGGRRVRVWSAGCSTGEEVYSLAIALLEAVGDEAGWDLLVVGSDLSRRALEAATAGLYTGRTMGEVDPARRERWFDAAGSGWSVAARARRLTRFEHHNLLHPSPPQALGGAPDLIFCRNVTIYLSREATRRIIQGFHRVLAPDGYLFLGHSETLWREGHRFRLAQFGDAFIYRKESTSPASLPKPAPAPPPAPRRAAPPRIAPPLQALRDALTAGSYAEAEALAGERLEVDALDAETYFLRAVAREAQERLAEAITDLRSALYLDPSFAPAELALAVAVRRSGDASGAKRHYRNAAAAFRTGDDRRWHPYLEGRPLDELVALCLEEGS